MRFAARQLHDLCTCTPFVLLLTYLKLFSCVADTRLQAAFIFIFFSFLIRLDTIHESAEVNLSLSCEEDNDTSKQVLFITVSLT